MSILSCYFFKIWRKRFVTLKQLRQNGFACLNQKIITIRQHSSKKIFVIKKICHKIFIKKDIRCKMRRICAYLNHSQISGLMIYISKIGQINFGRSTFCKVILQKSHQPTSLQSASKISGIYVFFLSSIHLQSPQFNEVLFLYLIGLTCEWDGCFINKPIRSSCDKFRVMLSNCLYESTAIFSSSPFSLSLFSNVVKSDRDKRKEFLKMIEFTRFNPNIGGVSNRVILGDMDGKWREICNTGFTIWFPARTACLGDFKAIDGVEPPNFESVSSALEDFEIVELERTTFSEEGVEGVEGVGGVEGVVVVVLSLIIVLKELLEEFGKMDTYLRKKYKKHEKSYLTKCWCFFY